MDETRRRRYLDAMGITVWVPRGKSSPIAPPLDAQEPAVRIGRPQGRDRAQGSARAAGDEPPPHWVTETPPLSLEDSQVVAHQESIVVSGATRSETVSAMDWEPLRELVSSCTACGLHRSRTQAVFGVGNPDADWMIVGEAPGADEDRLGEPFVGRAGKLLDSMLTAIGLDRSTVFIANILKCRPPHNRDPTGEETSACRPFVERQVELVAPRIILSVGRVSAQNLLGCDTAVGRLRGRVHRFGSRGIPLVVTYHPAYLLRRPIEKRNVWDDLKLAIAALHESDT